MLRRFIGPTVTIGIFGTSSIRFKIYPFSTSLAHCHAYQQTQQDTIYSVPRLPTTTLIANCNVQKNKENHKSAPSDDIIYLPNIVNLHDTTKWKCTLYQFETCPFCKKVRSCMDFFKIPYSVIEVHPLSKKELRNITDYKKVPVLQVCNIEGTNNTQYLLKDSKKIVSSLFKHEKCSEMNTGQAKEVENEWIKWSDDVLVQLIVMNIYRTLKESAETFHYLLTHPGYSYFEKYSAQVLGSIVMWLVSKKKKKTFNIVDERKALYAALNEFFSAKGAAKFHGGSAPNEADINVYGILRSIQGFSCEKDILRYTDIGQWMSSMQQAIQSDSACATDRFIQSY